MERWQLAFGTICEMGEKKPKKVLLMKELFNSWLTETKQQFPTKNKRIFLILKNSTAYIIKYATEAVIHCIKVRHEVWENFSYGEVVSNPSMEP